MQTFLVRVLNRAIKGKRSLCVPQSSSVKIAPVSLPSVSLLSDLSPIKEEYRTLCVYAKLIESKGAGTAQLHQVWAAMTKSCFSSIVYLQWLAIIRLKVSGATFHSILRRNHIFKSLQNSCSYLVTAFLPC